MPGLQITDYRLQIRNIIIGIFLFSVLCSLFSVCGYAQEEKNPGDTDNETVKETTEVGKEKVEPIIVNGDKVEYSTQYKEVTATGNVEVIYKGMKLTCDKLTVNTETKDGVAEGNARLEDEKGIMEGERLLYNFSTKRGTNIDSEFRFNPYFGRAEITDKISDAEFIARRGYMTTCSYDRPHYRIKSRKMDFFPGDRIKTRDNYLFVKKFPLFYLPQYTHSLKDPLMHVQLMPGKSKDWGAYLLTAWRYALSENLKGRIYFDYRGKLGVAEGFGLNYTTDNSGKGDFKYYYTQERPGTFEEEEPGEFQRYLIRWRHKWDIDKSTNLVSEYFKIVDSKRALYGSDYNFLKDYFFLEYGKDAQPLSYVSVHHAFSNSTLDFLMQKRTNRWYAQTEKLPEIIYTLPSSQIGESPFYFQNTSSYVNLNSKAAVPSPSSADSTQNNYNITDQFSLPLKIAFLQFNPSLSSTQSISDKNNDYYGSTLINTFSGGSSISTQFYRIFGLKSNFLNLDLNDLRHIITPSVSYTYSHISTMPTGKARFGGGASVGNGSLSLGLSNKLQTKRKQQKVDIADLRVSSTYAIKPESGTRRASCFSDFLFELELLPYSWMKIEADTTYNHFQDYFSSGNYDINLDFGKDKTINFGQRYYRKGGNYINYGFNWRFTPKWKFSLYHSRNQGHVPGLKRGLRVEEYTISRDLHCWTAEFTYNQKRGEGNASGEAVWLIFRLKAFPEIEFEYNQMYHVPKPGSQSNP